MGNFFLSYKLQVEDEIIILQRLWIFFSYQISLLFPQKKSWT